MFLYFSYHVYQYNDSIQYFQTLCLSCISRRNCNSFPDFYTKQAAAEAFKRSIQEFSNDHEQLDTIIEHFKKNKPNRYGGKIFSISIEFIEITYIYTLVQYYLKSWNT